MPQPQAEPTLADLARRLQRLEDIEAIRTLRNTYHRAINDSRFDEIAPLFTEDGIVDFAYMADFKGRAAIAAGFAKLGRRRNFLIKQFIHGHMVDVDGDRGTGISYLDARYTKGGVAYIVSLRYDDIYARQGGKWLFERMGAEVYFSVPAAVGWAADEKHWLKA